MTVEVPDSHDARRFEARVDGSPAGSGAGG
jgi:hypothetical protein